MNVKELKEELDNYGDHVEVVVLVEGEEADTVDAIAEVGYSSLGNPRVELRVER